ncbi:50S ribosomal protein L5 [Candidatus Adlerbacteria bacterium RIFCSPHIGHO2_01_FULL_54_23]|uniref:Large ribosomal subunit protein uL5 n=3 Tax=Candidatus Adleribacteriota TaxID=1752736 RepID=A0A1F4Y0E5_9BACT|nr:MAG: 50S ribosomal protein L5 [Candidatus Adlerbacteria bacterium GW2011_GWA1_54_10]KKW36184.1 MAG: 50S ribosomal protein L5 [Candidatus Adlerbacteria bacterium GW2011_GWA2_54_12]KKW37318.1 MAG: 50S ribosomal protein L5 [Candidatus Adlerbacteria bacterium GW2011_GWB1_54_7]OGC78997.1 MAG: 50S ribosomal protein L5 [Candidatus Adlerbacteria bacterium RIFCSPHIGHO2_01_FULL_54_23]OGC87437.1 MAG: 50S ribosomal protein L5 [Candidatus Adlerbacteria bacterium RIFCSPLOWO2_01_FULL_54_16]
MELIQQKQKKAFEALKKGFEWKNAMQTPRIERVVVSAGIGKFMKDKKKTELIADRLAKITGQKAVPRGAKKSIASYKTRTGDTVGYQITLRGKRMQDFLNRLIHIALPRTKDFKGLRSAGIDEMGNYTLGMREHAVFPETSDEELKDVFGIGVTVVTSAKDKKIAKAYLQHLGFPFKKDVSQK